MRNWINLLEDEDDDGRNMPTSDVYLILSTYVCGGEGASMHKFQQIYENWPRPDHDMTLYRVLRLNPEQMELFRQHHTFDMKHRAFSSWTKDEDAAKLLASTKGDNTIILTHTFPAAEIVIDVADFYEEHEMSGFDEYWKYVKPEQEVIVKHTAPFEINHENSRAHEHEAAPYPMIGDQAFYFDSEIDYEIEDVDYEQPYDNRGIYYVTFNDSTHPVRFIGEYNGTNQWEEIGHLLHESLN